MARLYMMPLNKVCYYVNMHSIKKPTFLSIVVLLIISLPGIIFSTRAWGITRENYSERLLYIQIIATIVTLFGLSIFGKALFKMWIAKPPNKWGQYFVIGALLCLNGFLLFLLSAFMKPVSW